MEIFSSKSRVLTHYKELTAPALRSHGLLRLPYVIETLGFVSCRFRLTCGTRMVCESHAVQLVGEQRSTAATRSEERRVGKEC